MPLIHKKNFIQIVCVIYTCLVILKLVLEGISGKKDSYYLENLTMMLAITVIATLVLSLHYYLQNVPLPVVMLVQYVLLMGAIWGFIWVGGHFVEVHEDAYRDLFKSFTIPYVIFAGVYYITFFMQVKNANKMLKSMKGKADIK